MESPCGRPSALPQIFAHVLIGIAQELGHAIARAFRIAIEQFLGGAGVHRDDRDAVSDDVVQFASNPRPLIDDGRARDLLGLRIGELRLLRTVRASEPAPRLPGSRTDQRPKGTPP